MYFDVLNDIVDKYNDTYYKTIKMKPVDVRSNSFAEYNEESDEKDAHVIMSEFQGIRIFLLKGMFLIGGKNLLF